MKDIPNTEYITINQDGIFIGGKPTKHYRGQELRAPEHIVERFKFLQSKYQNIKEVHMMTSESIGEYCATGNPTAKHGSYLWGNIEFVDGVVGPWVRIAHEQDKDYVAKNSPCSAMNTLCDMELNYMRQPMLGKYKDVIFQISLQNMAGKHFELNGYKISIEKITQRAQKQK
ncbi:MAG: hypothetical protein J5679_02935 [Alphaproteobacteria bacterium]|nr:hypothetical protein [Alphaproteobacteria bacterium]